MKRKKKINQKKKKKKTHTQSKRGDARRLSL